MKRKQLTVFAVCMAVLICILCGCDPRGNDERDTAPAETPAPVESAAAEPTTSAAPEPEPEQSYELPEVDDVPDEQPPSDAETDRTPAPEQEQSAPTPTPVREAPSPTGTPAEGPEATEDPDLSMGSDTEGPEV